MKTIEDLAPKPSDAIQAMIDGLLNQSKREDFVVEMETFASTDGTICFGCAATCGLQQLTKVTLIPQNIVDNEYRAAALGIHALEMKRFENAIDVFRRGNRGSVRSLSALGDLYSVELPEPNEEIPCLNTYFWTQSLEPYKLYVEQLKAVGL